MGMKVLEDRVLRRIFGVQEPTGDWGKMHNGVLRVVFTLHHVGVLFG